MKMTLRATRRYQFSRDPGSAPPHSPPQVSDGDVRHAERLEAFAVPGDVSQIREGHSAAGAQHADDLLNRAIALVLTGDVVNREARENQIEAARGEGERRHVRRLEA